VRRSSIVRVRGLGAFLALAMAFTLSAPPASAADARLPKAPAKVSLAAATAAHLAVLRPAPRAFQQEGAPAASTESRSFFRTPTGVAAVVLMVAGGAFTIYKVGKDQDVVKSPIR
jgi:hypothetical protein